MFIKQNKQRVISCGCCVYRNSDEGIEFLLVQSFKGNDKWGFPKGHVDPNETLEDTAHRETYEEAGISVKLLTPLPICRTKNKKEIKDVHLWLAKQACDTVKPEPHDPDCEIAKVAWHHIDSVAILLHRYQLPAFEAATVLIDETNKFIID